MVRNMEVWSFEGKQKSKSKTDPAKTQVCSLLWTNPPFNSEREREHINYTCGVEQPFSVKQEFKGLRHRNLRSVKP